MNKLDDKTKVFFPLQWSVTTKCNNFCRHCYMYDENTYEKERDNSLDLDNLIKILDSIEAFEKKYNVFVQSFDISGGDPLLRDDWYEFLMELKRRKRDIALLANPENLSEENIKKISNLHITYLQMSLDGLEKTHDYFRRKGSFQRTLEKIELLNSHNINVGIMFTLYPSNASELIPLMRFLAKNTKTRSFSFDIGCFAGNGKSLEKNFTEQDIFKILSEYLDEKESLKKQGYPVSIGENTHLLKLAKFQKGKFYPIESSFGPVISGCFAGWMPPAILSDGTVLPCRKLPLAIGKMPQESFENIFLGSPLLRKFRRAGFFEGCNDCALYSTCRGCPATVYSLKGDPFAKHPFCFKNSMETKPKSIKNTCFEPPMDASFREEWNFIKSKHYFKNIPADMITNRIFRKTYLSLADNDFVKNNFLINPFNFLESNKIRLDQDSIAWLLYFFGEESYSSVQRKVLSDQIKLAEMEENFFG